MTEEYFEDMNRYDDDRERDYEQTDLTEDLDEQAEKANRPKASKMKWFWTLVLVILCAVCVTTGYETIERVTTFEYVDKTFNILMVGSDFNYNENGASTTSKARSDTLMLAIFPDGSDRVGLISIPRDTLVNISSDEKERINGAFSQGGIELTKQVVSDLIGVEVNRYVIADFQGFKEMIDILGGVEINVEKRLKYDDEAGGTHIDLRPGLQTLNGEQALNYVRFRNDALGDISRVARQQNFMKAVAKRLLSWDGVRNYRSLWETFNEHTTTDITFNDIMALARRLVTFEMDDLVTYTLPGHFKDVFWEVDEDKVEEMVDFIMSKDDTKQ